MSLLHATDAQPMFMFVSYSRVSDVVIFNVIFASTSGQARPICSTSLSVSVSTTLDDAGFSSYPTIGAGRVSNVQFSLSNPLPGDTRRTATITFTAQAPLGNSGFISVTWPAGYLYGSPIFYALNFGSQLLRAGSITSTNMISASTPANSPWLPLSSSQ